MRSDPRFVVYEWFLARRAKEHGPAQARDRAVLSGRCITGTVVMTVYAVEVALCIGRPALALDAIAR